ncbi:hypothetical protein Tco_1503446 [Tanacetum coccineum]
MAALESCPKHYMITYLDKTDGNAEFHEIMDFLTRIYIYYALTVSPVVSTTFIEQFWMSAKSKTIKNVRYITPTVAGKSVNISEASIRSDILFDDADGIDTLKNQAVFDTIQLMGHLDAKKKFVMYPRFISVFLATQLKNVHIPLDHFPINALTKDEGEASERPSESQPIPSPPYLKCSGGNHRGQSSNDRSLSGNEDGLTLQSVYDLCCVEFVVKMLLQQLLQQFLEMMKLLLSFCCGWSSVKSEGVNEAERKFAQLANDEKIARKVQEEWETKEEKKRLAEEEATKVALIRDYDDIQAKIKADSILAARLQEEEREKFNIKERAKLLHDTIAAQRRFLAQQRAAEIRKIQVLYEKVKRSDENFNAIGSAENERLIKRCEQESYCNEQRRYFSTLMRVLSIFDREDINVVYQLVMDRYQDEILEVSWKLHGSSRVHTLMTEAELVIHMLVEKKYPLRKKVMLKMLELELESEEDSTMALELIRFFKKLVAELEPEDSDGNEKDL